MSSCQDALFGERCKCYSTPCSCCKTCKGKGKIEQSYEDPQHGHAMKATVVCPSCGGKRYE